MIDSCVLKIYFKRGVGVFVIEAMLGHMLVNNLSYLYFSGEQDLWTRQVPFINLDHVDASWKTLLWSCKFFQTFSNLVWFVPSKLEILTPDIWRFFFRIRYIEIPSFLRDHYLWILLIMMPRLQILHFPGQEMTRLPKNSNWKLGFSGKKISSNVRCQNFLFT